MDGTAGIRIKQNATIAALRTYASTGNVAPPKLLNVWIVDGMNTIQNKKGVQILSQVTLRPGADVRGVRNVLKTFHASLTNLRRDRDVAAAHAWVYNTPGHRPLIIRRCDFFKVMHVAKPPTQQMACLLMMRAGLRTGEVRVITHRDMDIGHRTIWVYDSKDKRYYPLPMHHEVAKAYLRLRTSEGFLLQRDPHFSKYKGPVTKEAVNYMVDHWAYDAGVSSHTQFTPRLLRIFFAKEWARAHLVKGELRRGDMVLLQKAMRHHWLHTTLHYIEQLVYMEDMQDEMDRLWPPPHPIEKLEAIEKDE